MSSEFNPRGNPIGRLGANNDVTVHPGVTAAIKFWTRQTLALPEETVLSVGEFGCAKPNCPNQQTVILVLSESAPTRKISIHKAIAEVDEFDVLLACFDPRNAPPS